MIKTLKFSSLVLTLFLISVTEIAAQKSSGVDKVKFIIVTVREGEHGAIEYPQTKNLKLVDRKQVDENLIDKGKLRMYNLRDVLTDFSTHLGTLYGDHLQVASDRSCRRCSVGAGIAKDGFIQLKGTLKKSWTNDTIDLIIDEDLRRYNIFYTECPRFEKVTEKVGNALRKHMHHAHDEVMLKYEKKIGKQNVDAHTMWQVYETIRDLQNANLPLPKYYNNATDYEALQDVSSMFLKSAFSTKEIRRLGGGLMVKDLLNLIDEIESGEMDEEVRMRLSVATDAQFAALTGALAGPDGYENLEGDPVNVGYSDYGAMHLMQVIQMKNGTYGVRIQFKDDTKTFFGREHILIIKGCDMVCSVPRLKELMKDILINSEEELKQECKKTQEVEKAPHLEGVHRIFPLRDPEEREIPRKSIEAKMWMSMP